MRKEIIWVAGIGILFGLIIAFGVWRINSSISEATPAPSVNPTPTSSPTGFNVTLDKPEDGDVAITSPLTVSGITKPQSWVVVSGGSVDYILQSGSDGTFSQDVDLTPGINQIQVTTFGPAGNQTQARVTVVYSSVFQEKFATEAPASSTDASGESQINQNVAQRLAEVSNQPKAFLGSVTDIADSTIEITNLDSQIQQISIAETGIAVIDTRGNSSKVVKLTDIAIGDFIIAMGYQDNSTHVLSAQRILIADKTTEPKMTYSLAKITNVTKNSLTTSGIADGIKVTLQPDKNTDIEIVSGGKSKSTKLSNLNIGDEIIYITDTTAGEVIPRSIFDIAPVSPTPTP